MNPFQKIALFFLSVLCFQSCTREISLDDLVEEQNKIVINSFINNTQPLSVSITKGFQFEEGKTLEELVQIAELKEAQVAIYESGIYIEDLIYQKSSAMDVGEFTASFIPNIGSTYRIEAKATDLSDTHATAIIPSGVDIEDASVRFGGGNTYPFRFSLKDPVEKNYYYIKMYFKGYVLDSLTQERVEKGAFVVEIPEGALPEAERYIDNGFLFKDDALESNAITISGIAKSGIPLFSGNARNNAEREELKKIKLDTSVLYIYLETLSEDAYKFHASNAAPLQVDIDLLDESAPVYSNVENGLGIFAGVYISEVAVRVE